MFTPNPALQQNPTKLCSSCVSVNITTVWRQVVQFTVPMFTLDHFRTWSADAAWSRLQQHESRAGFNLFDYRSLHSFFGQKCRGLFDNQWEMLLFRHSAGFGVNCCRAVRASVNSTNGLCRMQHNRTWKWVSRLPLCTLLAFWLTKQRRYGVFLIIFAINSLVLFNRSHVWNNCWTRVRTLGRKYSSAVQC